MTFPVDLAASAPRCEPWLVHEGADERVAAAAHQLKVTIIYSASSSDPEVPEVHALNFERVHCLGVGNLLATLLLAVQDTLICCQAFNWL